ncbi:MAG: alpha/beta hydrolase [Candidatus Tectomicrobia bacterium]|uniref:Alpha/beta hydrolase n=1 Tax=Tectimicrobiota bacterium TaxID=2528274 RepID=A0A937W492_UNCTE|nr:alpha/beta hydrolase [Candidatus Tectomicrobia bacterium]
MAGAAGTYDPQARYPVRVYDVTYRDDQDGPLLARIYQPQGAGPFPALLDIHGGAWSRGSYLDNARMDQELAASGLVVAALTCRQAPRYPYPSQVLDTNYGTRWFKAHAHDFHADPQTLGAMGTSSGGHTLMLSALRPHDPRYSALPLPECPDVDATLRYVLAAWPILDAHARYLFAQAHSRVPLVEATEAYFGTQEVIQREHPQGVLERGEALEMPPTLIIQGTADESVPLSVAQRFATSYRALGGAVELELFPAMPHGFARDPGPESTRAMTLMQAFIARQLVSTGTMVP